MVQYSIDKNAFLGNNDTIFEVNLSGGAISTYMPLGNLNNGSDAFGRQRVSEPVTLFDSHFRYNDNTTKWAQKTVGTASTSFLQYEGAIQLSIGTNAGDRVVRETAHAFGYQPGKSLLVMNSFVFSAGKPNLVQRVGYYSPNNGIFVELNGTEPYLVKRNNLSGTSQDFPVAQSMWNIDPLDGTGPSKVNLDFTKAHLFWIDIEWFGVGSVRAGFVINGQFITAHIFHHANDISSAYMRSANLPVRYEILNTGVTASASSMKQICTTVISEGGYHIKNIPRTIGNPITGKDLPAANTPMVSIRLKSGKTNAVVIPMSIDFYGVQATGYKYVLYRKVGSLTNANWQTTDSASAVEYDISATAMVGGQPMKEGIFRGQDTVPTFHFENVFGDDVVLSRGVIEGDSTGNIFTITITPTSNNDDAVVALTWQEHSQ